MDDIDPDCLDGVDWIWNYFGECVYTPVQVAGAVIGMLSIMFWLFAQGPQLYMNYQNGNADSLAVLFLVEWLVGDTLNLVGALLTHQLPTQIYTAMYFCMMDLALVIQFVYYKIKNRRLDGVDDSPTMSIAELAKYDPDHHKHHVVMEINIDDGKNMGELEGGASREGAGRRLHSLFFVSVVLFCLTSGAYGLLSRSSSRSSTGRVLLSASEGQSEPFFANNSELVGYLIGILSAVMYLLSRMPQILKNYRRKSTGGLSFLMFMFAVLGNVTYALGILMQSVELTFILKKLPWIVGSVGTLIFDFSIFIQFWVYDATSIPAELRGSGVNERSPLLSSSGGGTSGTSKKRSRDHASPSSPQKGKPIKIVGKRKKKKKAPISPLMYPAAQKQNYYHLRGSPSSSPGSSRESPF